MSDTEEILVEDYPDLGMPICLMLKRTSCLLINLKQPMQKQEKYTKTTGVNNIHPTTKDKNFDF